MIVKNTMDYADKETKLKGFVAYDDAIKSKRPLILVAPDWSGNNDFAKNKAEELAKLGYVGFALDMYGDGKVGNTNEEKKSYMMPLLNDRKLLAERVLAAFNFAKTIEQVDPAKVAAIGFCFGGLCALDLARSGADVLGIVSFHGALSHPPFKNQTMKAKILALHGHDDPSIKPEAVLAFETEMTEAKVDWQVHVYGNVKHAFTNPNAHDTELGLVYNKCAAERSWISMKNFLEEIFA